MDIGIPVGKYEITIGDSFKQSKDKPEYHTLKVDFKPASVAADTETYIAINNKDDVQMVVPSDEFSQWTVYQGSKKPVKNDKECLLVFDKRTGQLQLEKLSSNIAVKKIRGKPEAELQDSVRSKISQLHAKRVKQKEDLKRLRRTTTDSEMNGSSESSSSSDTDSDGEKIEDSHQSDNMELESQGNGDSDDELESQLEKHLMLNKVEYKPIISPDKQVPTTSATKSDRTIHDDLQLSESDTSEGE